MELGFASGVLCNLKQPRTATTNLWWFDDEETVFGEVTEFSDVVDEINVEWGLEGWEFDG